MLLAEEIVSLYICIEMLCDDLIATLRALEHTLELKCPPCPHNIALLFSKLSGFFPQVVRFVSYKRALSSSILKSSWCERDIPLK